MLERLAGAVSEGRDEVVLDEHDLSAMELPTAAELPDAFAAVVRLAATTAELARGELTLMLEGCSGPSGARLLGRFCHASTELEAMVRTHHAVEEARRPHAIFAEIVHLN